MRSPATRTVRAAIELYRPVRDPVSEVLARLDGVRPVGDGRWMARCPAHDDRTPSLSVARGRDGDALIRCHAGCDTADVLRALGMSWRDLFACGGRR